MPIPLFGSLSDSPSAVIAQLMIDQGQASDPLLPGTASDWPVSCDGELNNPDNVITITGTESSTFGRVQVTGQLSELWGIQFKIRAIDPQVAWAKANAIAVWMDQAVRMAITMVTHTDLTVGAYRVGAITRKGGALFLGRGEPTATKRTHYTINAITDIIQIS